MSADEGRALADVHQALFCEVSAGEARGALRVFFTALHDAMCRGITAHPGVPDIAEKRHMFAHDDVDGIRQRVARHFEAFSSYV